MRLVRAAPTVHELLAELRDCDWVLVEGFKRAALPKIEIWRASTAQPLQYPDDPHIVTSAHGVWRIKGIITVSRSIGDAYLKRPDMCSPALMQTICPFPMRRPVMSAVPSVRTRKLRPGDQFLIFASDGLWEQLTDEAAVDIVARSPRKGVAMRLVRAAQLEAARKKDMKYESIAAIEKGRRRRFHDDITVVVLFLDNRPSCAPAQSSGVAADEIDGTYAPVDVFSLSSDDQTDDPTRPVLR
jgi:pyruvate dehydrogenase phosphatase